jgi:hypothetical protein
VTLREQVANQEKRSVVFLYSMRWIFVFQVFYFRIAKSVPFSVLHWHENHQEDSVIDHNVAFSYASFCFFLEKHTFTKRLMKW